MGGAAEAYQPSMITVAAVLKKRYGLEIPEDQIMELSPKLKMASWECGYKSVEPFLAAMIAGTLRKSETDRLVSRVINSESYFFRHRDQFNALTDYVIPEIDLRIANDSETIKIWHAGCARGEEPYSMAIAIENMFHYHLKHAVEIVGTDVNNFNLAQAREAFFAPWNLRELNPECQRKYFIPEGKKFRLKESIRSRVSFKPFNLINPGELSPFGAGASIHLIMCRNVLIYFSKEHMYSALGMFWRLLADGGFLMLSPSEFLDGIEHPFKVIKLARTWIFRKSADETWQWALNPYLPIEFAQANDMAQSLSLNLEFPANGNAQAAGEIVFPAFQSDVETPAPENGKAEPEVVLPLAPPALPPLKVAIEKAAKATDAGDYAAALEILKQYPCEVEVELLKIRIAQKKGDAEFMRWLVGEFRTIFPEHPAGYFYEAVLSAENSKAEEAAKWLQQALYLDGDFVPAHIQLAFTYYQIGRNSEGDKAIRNARRILEKLEPGFQPRLAEGFTADELLTMIKQLEAN